jgi:hypothetical protein
MKVNQQFIRLHTHIASSLIAVGQENFRTPSSSRMQSSMLLYKTTSLIIEFSTDIVISVYVATTYFPNTISSLFIFFLIHIITNVTFNSIITPYLVVSNGGMTRRKRMIVLLINLIVKNVVFPLLYILCIQEIAFYQFRYIYSEEFRFKDTPYHMFDQFFDNIATIYLYIVLALVTSIRKTLMLVNSSMLALTSQQEMSYRLLNVFAFFVATVVPHVLIFDPIGTEIQPSFLNTSFPSWIKFVIAPCALLESVSAFRIITNDQSSILSNTTATQQSSNTADKDQSETEEEEEEETYEARVWSAIKALYFSSARSLLYQVAHNLNTIRITQNELLMLLFLQNIQAAPHVIAVYLASMSFQFVLQPLNLSINSIDCNRISLYSYCGIVNCSATPTGSKWKFLIWKWLHCIIFVISILHISNPALYERQEEIIEDDDNKSFMVSVALIGLAKLLECIPAVPKQQHNNPDEPLNHDIQFISGVAVPIIGQLLFYGLMMLFWKYLGYGGDMDAGLFHFKFALDTAMLLTIISTGLYTIATCIPAPKLKEL